MTRPGTRIAVAATAMVFGLLWAPGTARAAPDAAPAGTECVGLSVDATGDGGPDSAGCVHVKPGSTGIEVLEDAGDQVTTRDGGDFVCAINGVPASGCGGIDATHYWAYWHRAAGSSHWVYSSEGAGTYVPSAGATEGWIYDDGTDRTPSGVGELCPTPAASPDPSASPSRRAAAAPSSARPSPVSSHAADGTSAAATSRAAAPERSTGPPSPKASSGNRSAVPRATRKRASRRGRPAPSVSLRPVPLAAATPAGGSDTGIAIGLGVAALLGAGAFAASRRARR